jgi:hypothetical protein
MRIREFVDVQDAVDNHTTAAVTKYISNQTYSKDTRMTISKKRTSASCECAFCTLYSVLDHRLTDMQGTKRSTREIIRDNIPSLMET